MEEKELEQKNIVENESNEVVNTNNLTVENVEATATTETTEEKGNVAVEKKKKNKIAIGLIVALIIIGISAFTVYARLAPERAIANTVEAITKDMIRNSDTEVARFAMENDFNNINVYAGNEEPLFSMNVNRSEVQIIDVNLLGLPIKLYSDEQDAIINFGSDNYYRFDSQNAGADIQEYAQKNFGTPIPNMEYLNLYYDGEDKSFEQPPIMDDSARTKSYQSELNRINKQLIKSCEKTSTGKTEVVIDDETHSTKGYNYSVDNETLDIYMKDLVKVTMLYTLQTDENNMNSPIDIENEQFLNEEDAYLYDGLIDYIDSTEIALDVNLNIKNGVILLMEINTYIKDPANAIDDNYLTSVYFVNHNKILSDIRIIHSTDGQTQQIMTFGIDKEGSVQSGYVGLGSTDGVMTTNLKDATQYGLVTYSQDFATGDYDNGLITFDVDGETVEYVYTYNVIDDKLVFKIDASASGFEINQFEAVVSNEVMTETMPTPTTELNDVSVFDLILNEPTIMEIIKELMGLSF